MDAPRTLQEAVIFFADDENCRAFMTVLRWHDGIVRCPHCGSDNVDYLPNAKLYKCYEKHSKQKFSLKVGTIFEDSPIPLSKWLPVMWLIVNCKNGVSSYEIHRAVGVTQKSAWFMLQRARLAMQDPNTGGKLGGEVEVDETFIGGKARNMHNAVKARRFPKGQGPSSKAIVLGILERKGKIRTHVVETTRRHILHAKVRENVELGSEVFTDAHPSYRGLDSDYAHQVIDHAQAYVEGNVHTNGLENFWSLLKRALGGTYISVEPFHLFRYVDEQAFRYNHRKGMDDQDRFVSVMYQIVGKRLTYAELTGKVSGTESDQHPEAGS
jgi:transposase-like protein